MPFCKFYLVLENKAMNHSWNKKASEDHFGSLSKFIVAHIFLFHFRLLCRQKREKNWATIAISYISSDHVCFFMQILKVRFYTSYSFLLYCYNIIDTK